MGFLGLFGLDGVIDPMRIGEFASFLRANIDYDAPVTISCRNDEFVVSGEDGLYRLFCMSDECSLIIYPNEKTGVTLNGENLMNAISDLIDWHGERARFEMGIRGPDNPGTVYTGPSWEIQVDPRGYNCF